MKFMIRGVIWIGLYLFIILFPLVIAVINDPITGARPLGIEVAAAFGYVGLAVMAFQFALISRVHSVAGAFGQDALFQFHKEMGIVAFFLILLHPVLMFFHNYFPWQWIVNPFGPTPWEVRYGIISFNALLLLVFLSLYRKALRLSYEWWELSHRFLAAAAGLAGLLHMWMIGAYAGSLFMKLTWSVYVVLLGGLAVRFWILVPLRLLRRPWEVVQNKEERGQARTLVLRPVGHAGFPFEPGQFAWLMTGKSTFSLEKHPISFSSCGDTVPGAEVSLTIKKLGDWSGQTVPHLEPGRRVWLDGPYGVFSTDRQEGAGYALIGGGIGITPIRSMLLTFLEREDVRPVTLFYGSKRWEDLTFREELDALSQRMKNLKVVYVLESPPAGWKGETGFLTAAMLERHLPKQYKRFQYFVCGPAPLMDLMENVLPEIGVPRDRIHTERFDMV